MPIEPARTHQIVKAATRQNQARRRACAAAASGLADGRAGRAAEISGITVVITRRHALPLPVASLPERALPEPSISHWRMAIGSSAWPRRLRTETLGVSFVWSPAEEVGEGEGG